MKKISFLIIFMIIIEFQAYSQKTRDVLYLKDGSIIYGTIIEITGNQYKIRTLERNIFVFKAEEVDKYIKEMPAYEGRKKKGMGFAIESGFLMGPQQSQYVMPFSFDCLANYTLNTKSIFGIGTGVEFIGQSYLPLFFEYKNIIFDRKTAPFLFMRVGGLFHPSKDDESSNSSNTQYNYNSNYKGGISLAIGTGISWSRGYNETYLSFAYRYARTSYIQNSYNQAPVTFKNFYNRLEVKFGFKF